MTTFAYRDSTHPIREDLADAYRRYWDMLARPGNWWNGAERVAIAREVRNAAACEYCQQRKQALSPYNFPGEHTHGGTLPEAAVDAVHRVITDQSRITRSWIEQNMEAGLSEEHYVELVGIAVCVFSVDEFHRALGLPLEPLPEPVAGEPDYYRPARAVAGTGIVPMLPASNTTGAESDLWNDNEGFNIMRALSLVPDAVRSWLLLARGQYLDAQNTKEMMHFGDFPGRAINRMQMELVAGRVSAVNECFY